jgi:hypothetical protein
VLLTWVERRGQRSHAGHPPSKHSRSVTTSNGFNHDQKTVQPEITRFCSSLLRSQLGNILIGFKQLKMRLTNISVNESKKDNAARASGLLFLAMKNFTQRSSSR